MVPNETKENFRMRQVTNQMKILDVPRFMNSTMSLDVLKEDLRKEQEKRERTGRSISTPIGTTAAKSVRVLCRAFFSLSVSSSPIRTLLSNPVAAATSIAKS